MGASFAQNLAEEGHSVSMLDRSIEKMQTVADAGQALEGDLIICNDAQELIASLPTPRTVLVLVPSGAPLDSVIEMLKPLLDKGDLIADLGNSYYKETERRTAELEDIGLYFLGMGISGGAEGARHGPSIMAGGSRESWTRVEEIADVYKSWMNGPLNSYLIEIAGEVAAATDPKTGGAMLDLILDKAGQKGTGRWSVVEALHLGQPNSLIAAAVEARNISAQKDSRVEMEAMFGASPTPLGDVLGNRDDAIAALEQAMIAAKVCAYIQGFEILHSASSTFEWDLDLAAIARVWRAGCIIRSVFLDEISDVYDNGGRSNLALSPVFGQRLKDNIPALQRVTAASVAHGLHVPAMFAALSFHNMSRTGKSTANMIQGLRDYFGAHTFERLDNLGTAVNGPWHD
ncbi:UNVERIFIED_CONTAM: hypothetical protein GTU68_054831 [Idotea baltica]|nr:hypothetical protein [Idotea baltica]